MAAGNPLLAVYYLDGSIRLFEYASDEFVQIASTGFYPHQPGYNPAGVDFPALLAWARDSAFLVLGYNYDQDYGRTVSFTPGLAEIAHSDISSGFGGVPLNRLVEWSEDTFSFVTANVTAQYNNVTFLNAAGNLAVTGTTPLGAVFGDDLRSIDVSPDGGWLAIGRNLPSTSLVYERDGTLPGGGPSFDPVPQTIPTTRSVSILQWSRDSQFLACADNAGSGIEMFQLNAGVLEKIQDIAWEPGSIQWIKFSPDLRTMAVAYNDAGTFSVVTYYRSGPFFYKKQTIASFGALLDFDVDGGLMVDAKSKRVFALGTDGTWTEVAGAGTAIFSNAVAQAVSTHRPIPVSRSQLYDGALADILDGTADLNNLRIVLLTDAASFVATDTTVSQVTNGGAYLVASGGFPGAGLLLTGVAGVAIGNQAYGFSVDPAARTIVNEPLIAHNAMVYDATSGRPLLFTDLGGELGVPRETVLTLTFKDGKLLVIAP